MISTLNRNQLKLDDIEVGNLINDLSELSTEIDRVLRGNGGEPDPSDLAGLLSRLNIIADVYS